MRSDAPVGDPTADQLLADLIPRDPCIKIASDYFSAIRNRRKSTFSVDRGRYGLLAPAYKEGGELKTTASGRGLSRVSWRKASYSGQNGHCVEASAADGAVYVRDSKDPSGPALAFTREEWHAFLDGAKKGEFDSLI